MNLYQNCSEYVVNTYGERKLSFVKGKGTSLFTEAGDEYLDFIAGIGVNALGHSHPDWVKAMQDQVAKIIHTSNLYVIPQQVDLAQKIIEMTFPGKVFFANSGTEAIEGALKLVRKYSMTKYGEGRADIIAMKNSFHGRTLGALTATGQDKYQTPFKPLLPGFSYATFNDIQSLEQLVTDKTCAIILEPIQGEGGIIPADQEYLKKVRQLCDAKDILLVMDEVQCGFARTGKWYMYQHYDIEPDILTSAKGLGNGVPIGAFIAGKKVCDTFVPGDHAHTFGGNYLSCQSALSTIEIIEKEGILEVIQKNAEYFKLKLQELKEEFPYIEAIQGKGYMIGLRLNEKTSAREIMQKMINQKILVNACGENTLRMLPPFIAVKEEFDRVINTLRKIFQDQ